MKNGEQISYDYEISKRFTLIPIFYLITILFAVLAYREPFRFWQHAFSDLGMTQTKQGQPNQTALVINAIGMIVCAYQMLRIGLRYSTKNEYTFSKVKVGLSWIGVFGFIVSLTPNNIQHTLHSIGIGCVIGSIFLLTNILLFENRRETPTIFFFFILLMLYFTVLSYAYAFFVNSIHKQVFQKFCVIGLLSSILLSVRTGEHAFRLREIFLKGQVVESHHK